MFMAREVLPTEGRAAITIISPSCRPVVILSKSAKPGADAGEHALVFVIFLDGGNGFMDQVADRWAGAGHPLFADAENVALDFIQQGVHLAFVIVNARSDIGAGLDHFRRRYFSMTMSR